MDKRNFFYLLPINIIIIIFALYILNNRYQKYLLKKSLPKQSIVPVVEQKEFVNEVKETEKIPELDKSYRNILFQYISSKAKSVAIIGDFNDWTPQPFKKTAQNQWQIVLKLTPGKYLYNYLIDGQVKLDPNNLKPAVENKPRGFKSSVLVVQEKIKK